MVSYNMRRLFVRGTTRPRKRAEQGCVQDSSAEDQGEEPIVPNPERGEGELPSRSYPRSSRGACLTVVD